MKQSTAYTSDYGANNMTDETKPVEPQVAIENQGEKPDTLTVQINTKDIEISEQLEIGDTVKMTVIGMVKEIRNSRYWDKEDEGEKSKRKYMIDGWTTEVFTKSHVISVTDPEDTDNGEI